MDTYLDKHDVEVFEEFNYSVGARYSSGRQHYSQISDESFVYGMNI
jgi:hypothetical protein